MTRAAPPAPVEGHIRAEAQFADDVRYYLSQTPRQLPSRDLLQCVVHHRQKWVERVLIAITHLFEQPSELATFIGGRRHGLAAW